MTIFVKEQGASMVPLLEGIEKILLKNLKNKLFGRLFNKEAPGIGAAKCFAFSVNDLSEILPGFNILLTDLDPSKSYLLVQTPAIDKQDGYYYLSMYLEEGL